MKKILIVYFSGTGNTRKIACEYRSALEEREATVDILELPVKPDAPRLDPEDYDMIGLGYPIHAFNAPKIILEYCKTLPKRNKHAFKHAFIFKTSGEPVRMSDVSSLKMRKILNRRGYAVINEYQYVMPYNIIFRHTDAAVYKMWQTAKLLVRADVNEILKESPFLPRKMFMGGTLAWILRIEQPGARLIGRGFKTTDDCTKCGLCVKTCPNNNIKINKHGKIVFGGNCMICMRCTFNCPHDAIKPGLLNGWKVNGKYSFEPPSEDPPPDKHDNYCIKAYTRYYENAQNKISEFSENTDTPDNT